MYQDACDKANDGAHWAAYEGTYGIEGGTYLVLSHRDSMKEIDDIRAAARSSSKPWRRRWHAEIDELFGQAVDSSRTELFSINPKQSYAEEAWIKADPDFWKPKKAAPETAAAKPAAPKPAASASKPGGRSSASRYPKAGSDTVQALLAGFPTFMRTQFILIECRIDAPSYRSKVCRRRSGTQP